MNRQYQFPDFELTELFVKLIPVLKLNKIKFIIGYVFFIFYFSIPSFQIPLVEFSSFRTTSLMEQRAIENYLIFYPQQSWISIDNVNHNLLRGIIALEDGKFFNHKGIDWQELNLSLKLNKRRGRAMRGGSTITMQLAKNLYLNTDKNIFRKGKEFLITLRLEKEVTKRGILQAYINAIEWGDGIFGIKKASEIYYGKEPSELNINECSRLAAVIPAPLRYKPTDRSGYVARRAAISRGRMSDVILKPHL